MRSDIQCASGVQGRPEHRRDAPRKKTIGTELTSSSGMARISNTHVEPNQLQHLPPAYRHTDGAVLSAVSTSSGSAAFPLAHAFVYFVCWAGRTFIWLLLPASLIHPAPSTPPRACFSLLTPICVNEDDAGNAIRAFVVSGTSPGDALLFVACRRSGESGMQ